ncbi:uncharacterized protein IL334_006914 [Kwoniella shivajii]|uniref:BRCT domain-containing protein n=1 Tax=Kwoniella shivajii TaxID=564305 RepID=A0ABZ1D7A7_9TREE|nr:hypothetical protein IL334_006914 [Kwoniella shivajii]
MSRSSESSSAKRQFSKLVDDPDIFHRLLFFGDTFWIVGPDNSLKVTRILIEKNGGIMQRSINRASHVIFTKPDDLTECMKSLSQFTIMNQSITNHVKPKPLAEGWIHDSLCFEKKVKINPYLVNDKNIFDDKFWKGPGKGTEESSSAHDGNRKNQIHKKLPFPPASSSLNASIPTEEKGSVSALDFTLESNPSSPSTNLDKWVSTMERNRQSKRNQTEIIYEDIPINWRRKSISNARPIIPTSTKLGKRPKRSYANNSLDGSGTAASPSHLGSPVSHAKLTHKPTNDTIASSTSFRATSDWSMAEEHPLQITFDTKESSPSSIVIPENDQPQFPIDIPILNNKSRALEQAQPTTSVLRDITDRIPSRVLRSANKPKRSVSPFHPEIPQDSSFHASSNKLPQCQGEQAEEVKQPMNKTNERKEDEYQIQEQERDDDKDADYINEKHDQEDGESGEEVLRNIEPVEKVEKDVAFKKQPQCSSKSAEYNRKYRNQRTVQPQDQKVYEALVADLQSKVAGEGFPKGGMKAYLVKRGIHSLYTKYGTLIREQVPGLPRSRENFGKRQGVNPRWQKFIDEQDEQGK